MAENGQLCDFLTFNSTEEKETFIKGIIGKQLELSYISVLAYPVDLMLRQHLNLLEKIYDSNFYRVLATQLNEPVTILQFAEIFSKTLDE